LVSKQGLYQKGPEYLPLLAPVHAQPSKSAQSALPLPEDGQTFTVAVSPRMVKLPFLESPTEIPEPGISDTKPASPLVAHWHWRGLRGTIIRAHDHPSRIKMAMGNSPSEFDSPSPSPWGQIFSIPVPATTVGA
jgi:hypothetical protein